MTTERRIHANRQNSLASTGPRTSGGKAIVAKNAVKHGIFSREVLISVGDGQEDENSYARLLAGLQQALTPQSQMEDLLVEKIVVNYWRLQRLIRYETGEIRQQLDDFRQKAVEEFYRYNPFSSVERSVPDQPPMEFYQYGDEVSDSDIAAQAARLEAFSNPNWSLEEDEETLEFLFRQRVRPERNNEGLPEGWRDQALDVLERLTPQQRGKIRQEFLRLEKQILTEMEEVRRWNRKFAILASIQSIPHQTDLEKVVKYEAALERSIFRNLDILQRLQQARVAQGRGWGGGIAEPPGDRSSDPPSGQ